MNQEREKAVCISSLEKLQKKQKNPQEERLIQLLAKTGIEYWNGVKLAETGIYGAFWLHGGGKAGGSTVWMAFFLDRERLVLTAAGEAGGLLEELEQGLPGGNLEEGVAFLFDSMLQKGQQMTEKMEGYLIDMEREIVSGRIDRNRNRAIFECKRSLTLWKNDYVQLLNIAEGIHGLEQKKREQQEQLLTEECACFFGIYENKVRRVTEQIQFLYEELVHIREALDAAISYDQNRIMKVFTTVTTLFMPLTLVAGWYGMNFTSMPELTWEYGYPFVIVLGIAVILLCMIFFKKNKLL